MNKQFLLAVSFLGLHVLAHGAAIESAEVPKTITLKQRGQSVEVPFKEGDYTIEFHQVDSRGSTFHRGDPLLVTEALINPEMSWRDFINCFNIIGFPKEYWQVFFKDGFYGSPDNASTKIKDMPKLCSALCDPENTKFYYKLKSDKSYATVIYRADDIALIERIVKKINDKEFLSKTYSKQVATDLELMIQYTADQKDQIVDSSNVALLRDRFLKKRVGYLADKMSPKIKEEDKITIRFHGTSTDNLYKLVAHKYMTWQDLKRNINYIWRNQEKLKTIAYPVTQFDRLCLSVHTSPFFPHDRQYFWNADVAKHAPDNEKTLIKDLAFIS